MLDLLKHITQKLTGQEIPVEESEVEGTMVYTISPPQEIMGLLIGKGGKTIRAIRSMARARAIVDQVRVNVQLAETNPPLSS